MHKKRVLVLTPRFPYPAVGGDRIRILHLCRALRNEFELTLLSLCETREEMQFEPQDGLFSSIWRVRLPRWKSYWNTLRALPGSRPLQLAYYESGEFRESVRHLLPWHHLVVAHLIRTGQYIQDTAMPHVLEMTDAISMNYERMQNTRGNHSWKKLLYGLEYKRLKAYEESAVRRFDRVWLTSDVDRRYLDPARKFPIDVIPNGTDVDSLPFRPPANGGNRIVFIANMVSAQNQDACHSFIREILPLVRAQAPLVFRIVGNAPDAVRRQFAPYENVEMTGRIEHIEDGVAESFCGVCPVRAAAGVQNKVLEYLALGLPCVTSQVGLGGIDARPGTEVLLYRNAKEGAEQILRLYREKELRLRLAQAGHELVSRHYNWKLIYGQFIDSAIQACMPHRKSAGTETLSPAA